MSGYFEFELIIEKRVNCAGLTTRPRSRAIGKVTPFCEYILLNVGLMDVQEEDGGSVVGTDQG